MLLLQRRVAHGAGGAGDLPDVAASEVNSCRSLRLCFQSRLRHDFLSAFRRTIASETLEDEELGP